MIGAQFYAQVPAGAQMDYISENLRGLAVPVGCLIPDPTNPKKHGQRNLEVIRYCLAEFSQREVLVANIRSGQPVLEAGHGRLQALKDMGWAYVAVNFVEDDATMATKYLLASNQAALVEEPDDPGLMDDAQLKALLMGLEADGEDVEVLGFDVRTLMGPDVEDDSGGPDPGKKDEGSKKDAPKEEKAPGFNIVYEIAFLTTTEQDRFYGAVRELKKRYPDDQTVGGRLVRLFEDGGLIGKV